MAKPPRFSTPDRRKLSDAGPVVYRPGDAEASEHPSAEAALLRLRGVRGVGRGRTPTGDDAIICYVTDRSVAARLPRSIDGVPVLAEVTGEIDILPG